MFSQILHNKYTSNVKRFIPQWKQKLSLKNLQYSFKFRVKRNE